MNPTDKKRIVKDFEKLDPELQEQVKLVNPDGFHRNLISYVDRNGNKVTALPFETDSIYYLLRMTFNEAKLKMEEDEDYNDAGELKKAVKIAYEDKYGDLDYIDEQLGDEEADADEL